MPTWVITGCSSGLGHSLAKAVLEAGHNAIVTARDAEHVRNFDQDFPGRALAVGLDLTDATSISRAVAEATDRFGDIDVLVNNAGYGYRAAVEEGDERDVADLFATHVFGPVALTKALLPAMRARRQGTIANFSSIGAQFYNPGSGYYSAAKMALEGVTLTLKLEVEPLGIRVMVIEPAPSAPTLRADRSRAPPPRSRTIPPPSDLVAKRTIAATAPSPAIPIAQPG